jgi:hypothetical protein
MVGCGKLLGLGMRFSKSCNNWLKLVSDHPFLAFNVIKSSTVYDTVHSLSHPLDSSYRSSFNVFSIVSRLSKSLFLFSNKSSCLMLRNNSSTSMHARCRCLAHSIPFHRIWSTLSSFQWNPSPTSAHESFYCIVPSILTRTPYFFFVPM